MQALRSPYVGNALRRSRFNQKPILRHLRNLHLLQAEALSLVEEAGIPTLPRLLITSGDDVANALRNSSWAKAKEQSRFRIRAQVSDPAGLDALKLGRFTEQLRGFEYIADSLEEATEVVSQYLSAPYTLPSAPTGLTQRPCGAVLVSRDPPEQQSVRALIWINRRLEAGGPELIVETSTNLGPIGEARGRAQQKEPTTALSIDLDTGLSTTACQNLLARADLSLSDTKSQKVAETISRLYADIFAGREALSVDAQIQIQGEGVVVSDIRIELDDFALLRPSSQAGTQSLWTKLRVTQQHSGEARARAMGMVYMKPPALEDGTRGNIGCFGYGAGLAMCTMDVIQEAGGRAANFLDGGGGANAANAKLAVSIIEQDPDVAAILVNIFGGITQTDKVARGIIEAVNEADRLKSGEVPMVLRLRGTGEKEAQRLLRESGLPFYLEDDFAKAAAKVVELSKRTII